MENKFKKIPKVNDLKKAVLNLKKIFIDAYFTS